MAECAVAHPKFTERSAKTVPKQKAPPNWRGSIRSAASASPRRTASQRIVVAASVQTFGSPAFAAARQYADLQSPRYGYYCCGERLTSFSTSAELPDIDSAATSGDSVKG